MVSEQDYDVCTPEFVSLEDLREHFPSFDGKYMLTQDVAKAQRQTKQGKFPWHNKFLGAHKSGIQGFADVGCGLLSEAPLTVEASRYLNPGTKITAVDVVPEGHRHRISDIKRILESQGVGVLVHSIVEGPLPEKVDGIRFTGVSCYLNEEDRDAALENIHGSLRAGGILMGSKHVYKKAKGGFEIIAKVRPIPLNRHSNVPRTYQHRK